MKYTEEEIKMYFDTMMKKYPNCPMTEHLKMVKFMMFNDTLESNLLKNVVKKSVDK